LIVKKKKKPEGLSLRLASSLQLLANRYAGDGGDYCRDCDAKVHCCIMSRNCDRMPFAAQCSIVINDQLFHHLPFIADFLLLRLIPDGGFRAVRGLPRSSHLTL